MYCINMHICIHVGSHACAYMYVVGHKYTCNTFMFLYMYVCMHVCMHVYAYMIYKYVNLGLCIGRHT